VRAAGRVHQAPPLSGLTRTPERQLHQILATTISWERDRAGARNGLRAGGGPICRSRRRRGRL